MSVGDQPRNLNAGVLNSWVHVPAAGAIGPSSVSTPTSSIRYAVSNSNGPRGVNVSSDTPGWTSWPSIAGAILKFVAGLGEPTASRSITGCASSITTAVGTAFSAPSSWITTGDSDFSVIAARFGGASADPD